MPSSRRSPLPDPSADPELQATYREAAELMTAVARLAAAELHKAWLRRGT